MTDGTLAHCLFRLAQMARERFGAEDVRICGKGEARQRVVFAD
jgi:hypothetical protein